MGPGIVLSVIADPIKHNLCPQGIHTLTREMIMMMIILIM